MEKSAQAIAASLSLAVTSTIIGIASLKPAQETTLERQTPTLPAAYIARRRIFAHNIDIPYDPTLLDRTQAELTKNREQSRAIKFGHTTRTFSTKST